MQVDPFKPTLKAHGTERLKLKYGEPLSKFAFNFELRRCIMVIEKTMPGVECKRMDCMGVWASGTSFVTFDDVKVPARAYTRPLFSST